MAPYLFAALGLVILLLAGDALVRGAVNLSLRLGVPALIVSLTIVAFGTSAPELLISLSAVLDGAPGIALGNVVGSNSANVLLVLGVPALLAGLTTSQTDIRKSYLIMLGATGLFILGCYYGPIGWVHGVVFLSVMALILWSQAREALSNRKTIAEDDLEGADPNMPWKLILFFLAVGMVGLPLGSELLVRNGMVIARDFGVSEAVIGLTLIAIGTSLPELATTVMAAYRRQADVAIGNVIGSNIFNLLAIIGITSLVGQIPVHPNFLRFDLWVMLAASLLPDPLRILELTRSHQTVGRGVRGRLYRLSLDHLDAGEHLMAERHALVTGAGARLGRAMALYLANRGFAVAVHYNTSRAGADAVVDEITAMGGRAVAIQANLLDENATQAFGPAAAEALGGPLSVLVNSASIFEYDELQTATRESWDRHMGSNLRAPFVLTQYMGANAPDPDTDDRGRTPRQGPRGQHHRPARAQADPAIHDLHDRQDGALGADPNRSPGAWSKRASECHRTGTHAARLPSAARAFPERA